MKLGTCSTTEDKTNALASFAFLYGAEFTMSIMSCAVYTETSFCVAKPIILFPLTRNVGITVVASIARINGPE